MPQGDQVKNGKAFEYAIAKVYCEYICQHGANAVLVENEALLQAKGYYQGFSDTDRRKFNEAALATIDTMIKIEPGLMAQRNESDILRICLQKDQEGEKGDVRDVVFSRIRPNWEIGFSAKNNNDAVKHSRLGKTLDLGESWLGIPCSQNYWNEIAPVFDYIEECIAHRLKWSDIGEAKRERVYVPLLRAFRDEILRIAHQHSDTPALLVKYLIGNYPFYKIIKDDAHQLVVVKAFNLNGKLNQTVNKVKPRHKTSRINLPTRIVEFEMIPDSDTTLDMILDGGWEISFRLHSASKFVERSLKFDIKLLGNPPVLFTQHLFQ